MALAPDYAQAGFGGGVGWGAKPALLIVDMCGAYLQPGSPLFLETGAAVRDAIVPLAAAARAGGAPVIFTRVEYAHPSDGGLFRRRLGDQVGEARTFLAFSIARGTADDLYDLGQAATVADGKRVFAPYPVKTFLRHAQRNDDIHVSAVVFLRRVFQGREHI